MVHNCLVFNETSLVPRLSSVGITNHLNVIKSNFYRM